MDVDAFVLAHRPTWDRLEALVKRRRRLTGAEVDELVDLYQRVSTHLSMVRTASTDSVLVGRLSGLVAQARSAVTGAHAPLWSEFVRFWTVSFPVVAYRVLAVVARHGGGVLLRGRADRAVGGGQPRSAVQPSEPQARSTNWSTTTSPPTTARTPPASFALQVWVNNSWVAAQCIALRDPARHPDPVLLFQNAANLGVIARVHVRRGQGATSSSACSPRTGCSS